MTTHRHLDEEQLAGGLDHIVASPKDNGVLEMVLRRPAVDEREVLELAELSTAEGVVGDNWIQRSSTRTNDGSAHPDMQLNLMNARVIQLVAGDRSRWPLAGDQLFVDLDLSTENLAPWTKLAIGTAIIEITDQPHNGCAKFTQRFGLAAHRFVNAQQTRHLNLRGINARVVQPGHIRPGDTATKL